jgi:hypothetical protein
MLACATAIDVKLAEKFAHAFFLLGFLLGLLGLRGSCIEDN